MAGGRKVTAIVWVHVCCTDALRCEFNMLVISPRLSFAPTMSHATYINHDLARTKYAHQPHISCLHGHIVGQNCCGSPQQCGAARTSHIKRVQPHPADHRAATHDSKRPIYVVLVVCSLQQQHTRTTDTHDNRPWTTHITEGNTTDGANN